MFLKQSFMNSGDAHVPKLLYENPRLLWEKRLTFVHSRALADISHDLVRGSGS
jgi:hypothetical protein